MIHNKINVLYPKILSFLSKKYNKPLSLSLILLALTVIISYANSLGKLHGFGYKFDELDTGILLRGFISGSILPISIACFITLIIFNITQGIIKLFEDKNKQHIQLKYSYFQKQIRLISKVLGIKNLKSSPHLESAQADINNVNCKKFLHIRLFFAKFFLSQKRYQKTNSLIKFLFVTCSLSYLYYSFPKNITASNLGILSSIIYMFVASNILLYAFILKKEYSEFIIGFLSVLIVNSIILTPYIHGIQYSSSFLTDKKNPLYNRMVCFKEGFLETNKQCVKATIIKSFGDQVLVFFDNHPEFIDKKNIKRNFPILEEEKP